MLFELPTSITPRPGEKVITYKDSIKIEGIFIGYNTSDELIMKVGKDAVITAKEFIQVRPKNPFERKNPFWHDHRVEKISLEEKTRFDQLLNQEITPGPSYMDFINEIWNRGFEVFLVGGCIRDTILGVTPKDIDIVTTMPFNLLAPIARSMYGRNGISRKEVNGFMSVGFDAANFETRSSYDPLIDVKNFFIFAPGTTLAQFGADLDFDFKFRDFACNAIYYEPVNGFYIDPSGTGLTDARDKKLTLINDVEVVHPKYKKADISFRFFKFVLKGFEPSGTCVDDLNKKIKPLFKTIGHTYRIGLFRKYFLKGKRREEYETAISQVKEIMYKYGYEDIYKECIEPYYDDILE